MEGKKTPYIGRISSFGNSFGVIIDKKIVELLNLKKKEFIKIDIEKTDDKKRRAPYIAKITSSGTSLGVILDKKIVEHLDLNKGEFVKFEIEKIKKNKEKK